jgi:hypothetical protein
MAREKRAKEHYVNNKEFTQAIVDYCTDLRACRDRNEPDPMVPDYIARCLLRMCEGLSHKSNFVRYTYREEMVMDGVENCLKALGNFDPTAGTRGGNPNAFGYFTQIAWFAFLRRIQKEKKQHDVKLKFIAEQALDEFMIDPDEDPEVARVVRNFVDGLRAKIDDIKEKDAKLDAYKKEQKKLTNKRKLADSDLSEFIDE